MVLRFLRRGRRQFLQVPRQRRRAAKHAVQDEPGALAMDLREPRLVPHRRYRGGRGAGGGLSRALHGLPRRPRRERRRPAPGGGARLRPRFQDGRRQLLARAGAEGPVLPPCGARRARRLRPHGLDGGADPGRGARRDLRRRGPRRRLFALRDRQPVRPAGADRKPEAHPGGYRRRLWALSPQHRPQPARVARAAGRHAGSRDSDACGARDRGGDLFGPRDSPLCHRTRYGERGRRRDRRAALSGATVGALGRFGHLQPRLLDARLPPPHRASRRFAAGAGERGGVVEVHTNSLFDGKEPSVAKLDGKVAVVTGASSGIGEATVRALAAEGAAVVAGARRKERLDELVERVAQDNGKAIAVECDITDEEQAHALVQRAVEEFGKIDILVNNAGVMLLSTVGKSLSDQWRQMFEVNVMGLLYATDAAIGHMKEQGSGHLVNISSVAGRKVTRDSSGVYAGTKHAVNAISEGLRQELLEDNVRVSIVGPGAVDTELPDHITDEDAREGLSGLMNLERLQAEDIAEAIVYAVTQPERVSVNEILIRPTQQPV